MGELDIPLQSKDSFFLRKRREAIVVPRSHKDYRNMSAKIKIAAAQILLIKRGTADNPNMPYFYFILFLYM